jgi:hypothetical protein
MDDIIGSMYLMAEPEIQDVIARMKVHPEHGDKMKRIKTKKQLATKIHKEGGGFGTAVKKVMAAVNPVHVHHTITHLRQNKKHKKTKKDLTTANSQKVSMIANAYNPKSDQRVDIGDFDYRDELSDDWFSVYHNPDTKKVTVAVRGTRDKADILPDLKIAVGVEKFDKDFSRYEELKALDEFQDHDFDVTGHSLGGTKAMYIGEKANDPTTAYNPGYSYLFESGFDLKRDDLNLHIVDGDHVSNGILLEQIPDANLTVYQKDSILNPVANHTLAYFE